MRHYQAQVKVGGKTYASGLYMNDDAAVMAAMQDVARDDQAKAALTVWRIEGGGEALAYAISYARYLAETD